MPTSKIPPRLCQRSCPEQWTVDRLRTSPTKLAENYDLLTKDNKIKPKALDPDTTSYYASFPRLSLNSYISDGGDIPRRSIPRRG